MYLGCLRISEMAAIGIAQFATGPQKCVLEEKNVIIRTLRYLICHTFHARKVL